MTETPKPTAVVQRILPATPDDVFNEWIDPEAMQEWMCPRPAVAVRIELEPIVGGRLRIDIRDQGAEFSVTGTYLELDRPRRLRFTWSCSNWEDPTLETIVTVALAPHGHACTLMTITHTLLPPRVAVTNERGWRLIADQLENALLRRIEH